MAQRLSHLLVWGFSVMALLHTLAPAAFAQKPQPSPFFVLENPDGETDQSQTETIAAAARDEITYDRLPAWDELSIAQQRLVKTQAQCSQTGPDPWPACWLQLAEHTRATFFMITYALEQTMLDNATMIERVVGIEGILVPNRANHHHSLTNVTSEVDGWRIHLMIKGVTVQALVSAGWKHDGVVVETHKKFSYVESVRDHREKAMYKGPFLQLVLNDANDSSDSDLDQGRFDHHSSPKDIYDRFIDRYPETELVLKIS